MTRREYSIMIHQMPYRTTPFVTGQYYHIFNRGNEKRRIFADNRNYQRFLKTILYYQIDGPKPKFSHSSIVKLSKLDPSKRIVEINCYCLMPNHFHFILKQVKGGGISEFLSKLQNSYTKFFNTKYNRVGALFQGQFKAVLIESDEQLLHLSRYIHLNPYGAFIIKNLADYEWSSFNEYINTSAVKKLCSKDIILGFFKSDDEYKKFVLNQANYAQKLELIKHQLIDENLA